MRQWGYLQSYPGWRNWALVGALELENGPFKMSSAQLSLSPETMDEMAYGEMFKIIRVGLNPEGLPKDTHPIMKLVLNSIESPIGTAVPIVGR